MGFLTHSSQRVAAAMASRALHSLNATRALHTLTAMCVPHLPGSCGSCGQRLAQGMLSLAPPQLRGVLGRAGSHTGGSSSLLPAGSPLPKPATSTAFTARTAGLHDWGCEFLVRHSKQVCAQCLHQHALSHGGDAVGEGPEPAGSQPWDRVGNHSFQTKSAPQPGHQTAIVAAA